MAIDKCWDFCPWPNRFVTNTAKHLDTPVSLLTDLPVLVSYAILVPFRHLRETAVPIRRCKHVQERRPYTQHRLLLKIAFRFSEKCCNTTNISAYSWWRSILVVRPPVLAGELSLSCARLMAGRVTTNDGLRRWRLYCCWLPVAGGRVTARSLCVQAVGGGLSGLAAQFSDESALQVRIHVMRYTNRRLYFYFLLFTNVHIVFIFSYHHHHHHHHYY